MTSWQASTSPKPISNSLTQLFTVFTQVPNQVTRSKLVKQFHALDTFNCILPYCIPYKVQYINTRMPCLNRSSCLNADTLYNILWILLGPTTNNYIIIRVHCTTCTGLCLYTLHLEEKMLWNGHNYWRGCKLHECNVTDTCTCSDIESWGRSNVHLVIM